MLRVSVEGKWRAQHSHRDDRREGSRSHTSTSVCAFSVSLLMLSGGVFTRVSQCAHVKWIHIAYRGTGFWKHPWIMCAYKQVKASMCPGTTVDPRDISTSASAWSFWLQTVCGPWSQVMWLITDNTHFTESEKCLSVRLLLDLTSIHEEAARISYWVRKSDIFTVETRSDFKVIRSLCCSHYRTRGLESGDSSWNFSVRNWKEHWAEPHADPEVGASVVLITLTPSVLLQFTSTSCYDEHSTQLAVPTKR